MTREEAAKMIKDDIRLHHDALSGKYRHALNIAIKALEQPEVIRCKDCVNHVDDRCLAANHHTGDTEYCMEVFGAKMKGEQP